MIRRDTRLTRPKAKMSALNYVTHAENYKNRLQQGFYLCIYTHVKLIIFLLDFLDCVFLYYKIFDYANIIHCYFYTESISNRGAELQFNFFIIIFGFSRQ